MTAEESLNMIANYMGAPINGDYGANQNLFNNTKVVFPSNDKYISTASLKYANSWDWQIPVYSKLAKEMKEMATRDHQYTHQYFDLFLEKYENAIFNNTPEYGFKIIVENLQWLNNNK